MTQGDSDGDGHDDGFSSLSAQELKFFQKRTRMLTGFAATDLSVPVRGKKQKQKRGQDGSQLDALEAAEDAVATTLKKMQATLQNKAKGRDGGHAASDDSDSDEEIDSKGTDAFERQAQRKWEAAAKETIKVGLPVRSHTGEWKSGMKTVTTVSKDDVTDDDMAKGSKKSRDARDTATSEPSVEAVTTASPPRTETLAEAKERLALLAMAITENVDENLPRLKELLEFTRTGAHLATRDDARELVSVGLITTLAVFKDILPGYSIRPLTAEERAARMSKEVKRQRVFEETILGGYRSFITRLEEILKTFRAGDAHLVPVAVGCLGELAVTASHFNLFDRVLAALCGQVLKASVIGEAAAGAVERVLREDGVGQSTAHLLRLLSDMLQTQGYNVPLRAVETLLSVRLSVLAFARDDALPTQSKLVADEVARLDVYRKKQSHMSKVQKKQLRSDLEESVKLASTEAAFSREERAKWSVDSLKYLFRVLFGILKRAETVLTDPDADTAADTSKKTLELLPAVMRGLARYSQFLSVEFFADLQTILRRVISSLDGPMVKHGAVKSVASKKTALSLPTALYTIQTIVQINTLQETAPSVKGANAVDLKFYYDLLYRQLLVIPAGEQEWDELEELLESVVTKLFFAKRHVPAARVAAFCHRFSQLAESCATRRPTALYFARLVVRLLERHERARAVLDRETLGMGGYLVACPDADLCNPFSRRLDLDKLLAVVANTGKVPSELTTLVRKVQRLAQD